MSRKSKYSSGRGFSGNFQNMTIGQLQTQVSRNERLIPWGHMLNQNQGTRAAALFGSTVDSDWKTYHPLAIPRTQGKAEEPKQKKRPAPQMPQVPPPNHNRLPWSGTRQPGQPSTSAPPTATSGGLAVPANAHWLGNVQGMYGPAGELSYDAHPVSTDGGMPPRSALPVGRNALPPGSQFDSIAGAASHPALGNGGWDRANAIETTGRLAIGPGKPKKERRKAGINPPALANIQSERTSGGWPH